MHFAKKALLVVLSPLLPLLLFATALDFGIIGVAGQPSNVKKIINDSGVYDTVVSNALAQAKSAGDGLNLTDPAIKAAANQALSPQLLQNSTDQIIDGIYGWLDGKTPQPNFNVDLSGAKATFADAVAQAASARAATLPTCTAQPVSFDAFSADCLPAGVTPVLAAQQAKGSILGGQGFLDNPVVSADSLRGSDNRSVFEGKLKTAPTQYQRAKKSPYILAALSLVLIGGIVLLSSSWQKGLRHVGLTLLIAGILMMVFAWTLTYAIDNKLLPKLKFDNTLLQANAKSLIKNLSAAIEHNYWLFGGIYAALGVAAWSAPFVHRKWLSKAPETKETESADEPDPKPRPPKKIDI